MVSDYGDPTYELPDVYALPLVDEGFLRLGIERRSSAEQAATYIRRLIFSGRLRSGARIPQDEIARTLGMSKNPVREALIVLERDGWVTNRPHRGTFVAPRDQNSLRDHYQLVGLLYGFAVRAAMARDTQQSLPSQLSKIYEDLRVAESPLAASHAAARFHSRVAEMAQSPPTRVLVRSMSGLTTDDLFVNIPEAIEIERRGLAAVLRAVNRHDPDKAAEAYFLQAQRVGELVVELFRSRGLLDPQTQSMPVPLPRSRSPRRSG